MPKRTRRRSYLVSSGRVHLRLTEAAEGGYVVTSPHDPALVTQAESIAEAFENAAEAARILKAARLRFLARLRSKSRAGYGVGGHFHLRLRARAEAARRRPR